MLNEINEISIFGVLVATVANFLLGGIYFGAIVTKPYAIAMGRDNEPKQKPTGLMIVGPAVCGLAITFVNAVLMKMLNIQTVPDALLFAVVTGFGYLIPMTMTIAINPNFPRPFFYTAINTPYFLISNLIGCAILVSVG